MQRSVPRGRQVRRILRKFSESDFSARTGVLRLELSGSNEGDDGHTCVIEDRFIMDTTATELRITKSHAAPGSPSEIGFVQNARVENLDVETVTSNPFLPADRKWAIRFNAATLPAVLQTPVPSSVVFRRGHIGPVATAVADVIEGMCDRVVERGRLAFAAMAYVGTDDVGFDQSSGRFFVLDRNRSGRILEIAATTRGRSSVSTEFAKKLQRANMHSVSKEIQPSAAWLGLGGGHDIAAIEDVVAGG
jgi:hypothetical protein